MSGKLDVILAEYQREISNRETLIDIRFKLLVFVPTVTSIAAALVTDQPEWRLAVAFVGLVTTLAVVFYEIRNSQMHDLSTHNIRMMRKSLGFDEEVLPYRTERPVILRQAWIYHDAALAMIYGISMAAWTGLALVAIRRFLVSNYGWAEKIRNKELIPHPAEVLGTAAVASSVLAGLLVGWLILQKNSEMAKRLELLSTSGGDPFANILGAYSESVGEEAPAATAAGAVEELETPEVPVVGDWGAGRA